jgi:hypothetical protein
MLRAPTEEFAFLQLKKADVVEIHRALMNRWLIEDKLRQAQGLESIGPSFLIHRLEHLLNVNEEEAHALFHSAESELWEYSWYTYTDEWAWHRAEQDVRKALGARFSRMNDEQLDELIDKRREDLFETYLSEVSLEEPADPRAQKKATKTHKK